MNADGWLVTITYEDGYVAIDSMVTLKDFSAMIGEHVKVGHGDIIKIEMV